MKRHKIDISKLGTTDYLENRIIRSLTIIGANPDGNYNVILDKYLNLLRLSILNKETTSIIKKRALDFVTYSVVDIKRNFENVDMEIDGVLYSLNKYKDPSSQINYNAFKLINLSYLFELDEQLGDLLSLSLPKNENPYWLAATQYLKQLIKSENDQKDLEEYENLIETITENGTTVFHSLQGDQLMYSADVKDIYENIHNPVLVLYKLALLGDETSFNQTLKAYTTSKKTYIGKMKKLHVFDYWIDFNGMAACTFAMKKGMKLTYKTEYIPI